MARFSASLGLLITLGCSGSSEGPVDLGARTKLDGGTRLDTGVINPDAAPAEDAAAEDAVSEDAIVTDAGFEDVPESDTGPVDLGTDDSGVNPDAAAADATPADTGGVDCTFGNAAPAPLDPRTGIAASRLIDLEQCVQATPGAAAALVNAFLADFASLGSGAPYDNGEALVLFRGDASNLTVSGSFDMWPDPGVRTFRNIPNTDLHVARIPLAVDARAQYKLTRRVNNNTDWFTDPLNRWVTWDGINRSGPGQFNNELVAPQHVPSTSLIHRFFIVDRDVFLQLPVAHWTSTGTMGVLYVNDGNEYLTRSGLQTVVDQTIAGGGASPVALAYVALPNQNIRFNEYTYGPPPANADNYIAYLAASVIPAIEAQVRVAAMPDNRGLAGASLGGLISLYGAWTRSDVFRKVGGQSSSLFWREEVSDDLLTRMQNGPVLPLQIYLDSGCTTVSNNMCVSGDNYVDTVEMVQLLMSRGYNHRHVVEVGAPHDWAPWARRFPQLLEFLY